MFVTGSPKLLRRPPTGLRGCGCGSSAEPIDDLVAAAGAAPAGIAAGALDEMADTDM